MILPSLSRLGRGKYGAASYRFLRLTITANVGSIVLATLWNLAYSADGGASYLPSSNMTSNSLPSPLVALASSEYDATVKAFQAFDENTFPATPSTRWASINSFPSWIQIDLGAGNGISPNRVKMQTYNDGTFDCTPKDFTIKGSNSGAFAGEETTLLTKTGETTKAQYAVTTYTI